jgi:hypothetical protein
VVGESTRADLPSPDEAGQRKESRVVALERDPEELGEPSYEEIELDMDVRDSIHTFNPGPDGRCVEHLIRHGAQGVVCGSTQRSSVFHDDPDAAFREAHWHGGGDCMCFEFQDYA